MTKTKQPKDALSDFLKVARDRYETDVSLENEKGVDIKVEGVGTFTALRAHTRNPKFIKGYREQVMPYADSAEAKAVKKGDADPKLEQLSRDLFADVIIVGLKDAKGNKIPYDDKAREAVKALLSDTPDLYLLLQSEAMNAENFRKHYKAEEKN